MWTAQEQAAAGQYILVEMDGGWNFDLFSQLGEMEVRQRVNDYARGWQVVQIQLERGLAGAGAVLRVYGRATETIQTSAASMQAASAINSFWTVAGVTAQTAMVNDVLTVKQTPQDVWGQRIDTALIVIGLVALAWFAFQVRKGIE